jgi:hypothetical protein
MVTPRRLLKAYQRTKMRSCEIDIQQNGYTTKVGESISKNKNEELRKPFKENPKASLGEIPVMLLMKAT